MVTPSSSFPREPWGEGKHRRARGHLRSLGTWAGTGWGGAAAARASVPGQHGLHCFGGGEHRGWWGAHGSGFHGRKVFLLPSFSLPAVRPVCSQPLVPGGGAAAGAPRGCCTPVPRFSVLKRPFLAQNGATFMELCPLTPCQGSSAAPRAPSGSHRGPPQTPPQPPLGTPPWPAPSPARPPCPATLMHTRARSHTRTLRPPLPTHTHSRLPQEAAAAHGACALLVGPLLPGATLSPGRVLPASFLASPLPLPAPGHPEPCPLSPAPGSPTTGTTWQRVLPKKPHPFAAPFPAPAAGGWCRPSTFTAARCQMPGFGAFQHLVPVTEMSPMTPARVAELLREPRAGQQLG